MTHDLTPRDLAQLVELGEAEAYVDFYRAAPPDVDLRVERFGSAVALLAPKIDILLLNRAIGVGLLEPATTALVDEIVAMYRRADLQHFGFQLSPTALPAELPDWLQARGLPKRDNWAKVYRRPDPQVAVTTDLRIEPTGRNQANAFAQVAIAAFGMPDAMRPWIEASVGRAGWLHYLAFDDDTPIATGALFIRDRIGWLGMGATLPSHRRRGAQGAIMAQRIRDAAAAGCAWVITETGEDLPEQPNPSFHNMIRTGFELAYQRPNYIFTL